MAVESIVSLVLSVLSCLAVIYSRVKQESRLDLVTEVQAETQREDTATRLVTVHAQREDEIRQLMHRLLSEERAEHGDCRQAVALLGEKLERKQEEHARELLAEQERHGEEMKRQQDLSEARCKARTDLLEREVAELRRQVRSVSTTDPAPTIFGLGGE